MRNPSSGFAGSGPPRVLQPVSRARGFWPSANWKSGDESIGIAIASGGVYGNSDRYGGFVNSNVKTLIFWVVLICVAVLLFAVVRTGQGIKEDTITFTQFLEKVTAGEVKEVTIADRDTHGVYQNPNLGFHTQVPANYPDLYKLLNDKKVNITIKDTSSGGWVSILLNASPFIVLLAFWIFMMRQMQSGGNKALSFGKSRARLHSTQQKKVTFKDVAGVEEAKEELQEIIEFLREPQKFQKLGGRIPKGRARGLRAAEPAHRQRDQHRPAAGRAIGHHPRIPAMNPRGSRPACRAPRLPRPAARPDHHRVPGALHLTDPQPAKVREKHEQQLLALPGNLQDTAGGGDRPRGRHGRLRRQRGSWGERSGRPPRPTGASLPGHADTPHIDQIVTSRHSQLPRPGPVTYRDPSQNSRKSPKFAQEPEIRVRSLHLAPP